MPFFFSKFVLLAKREVWVVFAASDLLPVGGNFRQVEGLTEVHQVQHVLLETAAAES